MGLFAFRRLREQEAAARVAAASAPAPVPQRTDASYTAPPAVDTTKPRRARRTPDGTQ